MTPAALREVPRPVPGPTTLDEALAFYAGFGLPVTPVRPGDKAGYKKGWSLPGHAATRADFRLDDNVGVLNGTQHEQDWFFHDTFEAPTRFDKLFSGIVVERPKFIKTGNRGAEHIGPEDTFDGDYGRLLEQFYVKRVASPTRPTRLYFEGPLDA